MTTLALTVLLSCVLRLSLSSVCLVVPFRSRWIHLSHFIAHMEGFLKGDAVYFVVEQADNLKFNRASLINIGALMAEAHGCTFFVMHDVDTLPLETSSSGLYDRFPVVPTHLVSSLDRRTWQVAYEKSCGAVFSISMRHFRQINGMSNRFYGWGAEDDEFFQRLLRHKLTASAEAPHRTPSGVFFSLPGEHHTVRDSEGYQKRYTMIKQLDPKDGLSNLSFETTACYRTRNFFHIRVKLNRTGVFPPQIRCEDTFSKPFQNKTSVLLRIRR